MREGPSLSPERPCDPHGPLVLDVCAAGSIDAEEDVNVR